MLAVQILSSVDHTVQLCNELCKWKRNPINRFEYFSFSVLPDIKIQYIPKTVVSSGISSMKHLRSVSLMWKYSDDEKFTMNAAKMKNVNSVLNILFVFFSSVYIVGDDDDVWNSAKTKWICKWTRDTSTSNVIVEALSCRRNLFGKLNHG